MCIQGVLNVYAGCVLVYWVCVIDVVGVVLVTPGVLNVYTGCTECV